MSRSKTVLFVSAGLFTPKKRDHPLARRQLYLNYGALALATQLNQQGVATKLVHGAHDNPDEFLAALIAEKLIPSEYPIMLSLPSFYALGWAKSFCRRLKTFDPSSRIILGGRWVTNPDPDWLSRHIPEAEQIVCGLGEGKINGLVGINNATPEGRALPDVPLDHLLVRSFELFQPSLEASRGCGMGCHFCEERAIPLSQLKSPNSLANDLETLREQYQSDDIHPYLQSSYFLPNPRWAKALRDEIENRALSIQWRTETRVDSMKGETIEYLAAAGLKVLDLGLETASPRQIRAMGKSQHPDRYLAAASTLLKDCAANGVDVKVNVLLYAGETEETLSESKAWLDAHAALIKGVSVGPVIVYGPPKQAQPLLADLMQRGARPVDSLSAERDGVTTLHLSQDFDAEAAEKASLHLSRRYMSQDDYFDLKMFSYYPRSYRRADFDADMEVAPVDRLPFSI